MNMHDQELRERCLNLAADVFRSPGITGHQLTTVAEHFYQYIKNGGDTEYDHITPTPPDMSGPISADPNDSSAVKGMDYTAPGIRLLRDAAEIPRGSIYNQ